MPYGIVNFSWPNTFGNEIVTLTTSELVGKGLVESDWAINVMSGHHAPNGETPTADAMFSFGIVKNATSTGTIKRQYRGQTNFRCLDETTIWTSGLSHVPGTFSPSNMLALGENPRSTGTNIPWILMDPDEDITGPFRDGGIEVQFIRENPPTATMPPFVEHEGFLLLGGTLGCTYTMCDYIEFPANFENPVTKDVRVAGSSGGLQFTPDVMVLFGTQYDNDTNLTNGEYVSGRAGITIGIAVNDASETQMNMTWIQDAGLSQGHPFQRLSSDDVLLAMDDTNGNVLFRGHLSFGAGQYTIDPSPMSVGQVRFCVLAMKMNLAGIKLIQISTPTGTGQVSYTGVGFKPRACLAVMTGASGWDSLHQGSAAGCVSVSAFTAAKEAACLIGQGVVSAASQSLTIDRAICCGPGPSIKSAQANLVSMDADGFTLNWTEVGGQSYDGFILCMGDDQCPDGEEEFGPAIDDSDLVEPAPGEGQELTLIPNTDHALNRWLVKTGNIRFNAEVNVDDVRLTLKRGIGSNDAEPVMWVRASKDGKPFGKPKKVGLGKAGDGILVKMLGGFGSAREWQFEFTSTDDCEIELRKCEVLTTPVTH